MEAERLMDGLLEEISWYKEKFFEYIIDDDDSYEQLVAVKANIIKLELKYNELHQQMSSENVDKAQHFDMLQLFISFQARINRKLKAYEKQQEKEACNIPVQQSQVNVPPPVQQNFRLPEIPLPVFNGHFDEWLEFSATFKNIIINNDSVSENLKFYYLKQALSGEALSRIQNIPPGKDDFELAWDLLTQRYHNPRLIASSHISAIESPPMIKRNCSQSLRTFIDHCKCHINALENLKLGVELKDLLYLHKILAQLDQSTLRDWERCTDINKIPSMQDLWDFLEKQCKIWDAVPVNNTPQTSQNSNQKTNQNNSNHSQSRAFNQRPSNNNNSSHNQRSNNNNNLFSASQASNSNSPQKCNFCQEKMHPTFKCPSLLQLQPSARVDSIKRHHLCINCLKPWSSSHVCSAKTCFKCGNRHHTIIHDYYADIQSNKSKNVANSNVINSIDGSVNDKAVQNCQQCSHQTSNTTSNCNQDSIRCANTQQATSVINDSIEQPTKCHSNVTSVSLNSNFANSNQVDIAIMPTAEVFVINSNNQAIKCTALIDSGSDCNLISKELASQLKLISLPQNTTIHSVGNNKVSASVAHCITIKSNDCSWSTQQRCIVVDQLSHRMPRVSIDLNKFNIPTNIRLANPQFHQSKKIDLVLGVGIIASISTPGLIVVSENQPILQNSKLGWLVFGSLGNPTSSNSNSEFTSNFLTNSNVSFQLENFWKLEEVSSVIPLSADNKFVENHYESHTIRQDDGRFMVSLPRKESFHLLGNSKFQALKRFHALEKRLSSNADLKSQYVSFMNEYKQLDHMVQAPPPLPEQKTYYLPHHCVLKPDSTSTKLRVVFDASAKTSSGLSLNDVLHVGPTVQPELFEIVLRFRTHPIAFIADVSKMYRQILLDPADRDFHRILWRDDPSKPLLEYQLKTVTYGTAPAAFLSTRCLIKLADLEASNDAELSHAIKNDFYVDDLLCGAASIEQAKSLAQRLLTTMDMGGFQLRKWMSNSPEVLNSIPSDFIETASIKPVSDVNDSATKALGLIWNSQTDNLSISSNINEIVHKTSFSKREFLSCVASIFDPLGLISPVVISCKILFQELWLSKINWDDPLPINILAKWLEILQKLNTIPQIVISRCVISKIENVSIELHGFSDASLRAYGACIYIRSISAIDVQSKLLCSKSRVAPLKSLTVPKLELCAALLLSRLVNKVVRSLNLPFSNIFLWSDSKTVCDWLKSPADKKNIFIAVRVTEIQESTSNFCWNHVKTANNPADIISRGCKPDELQNNSQWWCGPSWLTQPQDSWDSFSSNVIVSQSPQVSLVVNSEPSVLSNIFSSCSTYNKMIRTTAYIYRFLHNIRHPENRFSGSLTVDEISDAEIKLLKVVQNESFSSTIKQLQDDKELPCSNPLHQLSLFIHSDGLVRVGGRLQNANIPFDFKHQILIPNKHKLTKALIVSIHRRLLHAGIQVTMASVRQKFWIPSTCRTIRSVLHSCLHCLRFSQVKSQQLMGQLPSARVNIEHPFFNSAVDYAGPISLRLGGPKSRTFSKAYIAIFVCMVTRAVHVEIVTELSTKAFLAALTRFIARRGLPNSIHSDNATNFQGANSELQELSQFLSLSQNQKVIQTNASLFNIQWCFIPPRAPHFGGLWENAVKNFKKVFRVVTHNQILNLEELFTLSAQIEAILNSRPIVPLSEDPHDLAYLSPGHFLIGRPITALPFRQQMSKHIDHLSRWKRLTATTQSFWDRWSNEYLVTLQRKQKWSSSSENLQVGTLVILKDPGTLPSTWKLARITQLHPGSDNKVRVVTILTASGSFKRPITNLVPIPLDDHLNV